VSGPHIEDELFGMTEDERQRMLADLYPEPLNPPRRGFHHTPPATMPPDDEEDVGAEDGEDVRPPGPDGTAGCVECYAWLPDPGGRYAWTVCCEYVHCTCACHPEPMGRR
jgi:hypothetical protein